MRHYPDIHVRKLRAEESGKIDQFVTVEDFEYEHPLVGRRVVRAGFITDGMSIPQWLWWLIPPHGHGFNPAVVHDDCYINKVGEGRYGRHLAKDVADGYFRKLLKESGIKPWQYRASYVAVRYLGLKKWRHK